MPLSQAKVKALRKKRNGCPIVEPHCHETYGKVNQRHAPKMSSMTCMPETARMRPDPATSRYIEVSTAHRCPPGYNEGARTVRRPASASVPGGPSKACPESCTDILADQERRSRERRQLEAHPGDFKIGEPKMCPPGYPTGRQLMASRGQPSGMNPSGVPGHSMPTRFQSGGMQVPKSNMCQPRLPMERNRFKQGGVTATQTKYCPPRNAAEEHRGMAASAVHPTIVVAVHPGMQMGGVHPAMASGGMADPKMCPPKFSVGLSPDSSIRQDPKCAVDYHKCAPKRRPGVCGPNEFGTSMGHNSLGKIKSRELIGGVLLTGCDCVKRNGLQHDCKRTLCQGRPECLTNPPMCLPSGGPGCIPMNYFES